MSQITWLEPKSVTCHNVSLQFMDVVIALRTGEPMLIAGRSVRVVRVEAEDGSRLSWNIQAYDDHGLVKIYWNEARNRVTFSY